MWGCYARRPRRCRWRERTGSGNFGPMSTPGGRKVRCLLQWREETKSVKEAERSHSDVYIFLHWIYEKFDINQCKFRNGKMLPSFPFCSGKRPGGRQGGSGKKRWPQEQGNSNTVLGKWKNCTSLKSPATNHSFYISFENPKHIAVRKGTTTITEIQMISQRLSNI